MIGTFAYLILTSARNRVRARLARLRNPRYAIAAVLGVAYVWVVYLRPSAHGAEATSVMSEGGMVADVIVAIASIDPVMGGVDR